MLSKRGTERSAHGTYHDLDPLLIDHLQYVDHLDLLDPVLAVMIGYVIAGSNMSGTHARKRSKKRCVEQVPPG